MQLRLRREENKIIAEGSQEKKWKRKQLKYWWVASLLAIVAIAISVVQFVYTTSKESDQQLKLDKINADIKQYNLKYERWNDSIDQLFTKRKDSLLMLRESIENDAQ